MLITGKESAHNLCNLISLPDNCDISVQYRFDCVGKQDSFKTSGLKVISISDKRLKMVKDILTFN